MTLDSTGSLSFSELKSEYGVNTTSCSYSQLKRGDSFVDNTKDIEATDAISSVTEDFGIISANNQYPFYGTQSGSFGQGGYSERWNHGNLNTWSFSNTTNQNLTSI